ncbi:MAG TPA: adenosylcobinamide-phosphate synthase CbiB [Methylophilaceae bacterium]|nr:adenosylcobinamide-phosphate synthase CbiB [Methylophilaceae bacterium]
MVLPHYPIIDWPPTALIAAGALLVDWLVGEPSRFHGLVGFGRLASLLEARLNPPPQQSQVNQRLYGLLGVAILLIPLALAAWWLCHLPILGPIADLLLLYFAIGHRSLHEHAQAVLVPLQAGDLAAARQAASHMVSRDLAAIEPVSATVESVLENGNDGIFGALLWFFIAGGAGALTFRLVNTLDAMWGYRSPRFHYFGWSAAKLDDLLGYLPARLTALTYALLGNTRSAFNCWKRQASTWDSPNAGPVMAAGAGALSIRLGGPARYQGRWHERPPLGIGELPHAADIGQALALVTRGVYLWLAAALLVEVLLYA